MLKIFSFILPILGVITSFTLEAQNQGVLTFEIEEFDFKEIKERGGAAAHTFEFVNTGNAPIVISKVKASCGCTTPAWSKEPVLPGEKGFVTAEYNPFNRPGSFRKSLTITSNAVNTRKVIYIKGKVLPRIKTIEEKMPYKAGSLRFKSKTMNMGKMTTEQKVSKTFEIYNDGDSTVAFLAQVDKPSFMEVSFDSVTIDSKEVSKLTVVYDPNHEDHLGYNNHGITLYTNESTDAEKNLNIVATITEFFPEMSEEELKAAPKLKIEDRFQDIGKIQKGDKVPVEFVLFNDGASNLNIRKIKSNCACFVIENELKDIKAGDRVVLKAIFDSKGRRGGQNKSITIYSNDPSDPTQVLSVKASISLTN